MKPKPGMVVSHDVKLKQLLGRGGMGTVWIADHGRLECEVAVKFIQPKADDGDNKRVIARFEREAKLAARLTSPHAIRTFDHGITDTGVPYIVMELLRGESLEHLLKREGHLPLYEVMSVVSQVADVLENAHALGVVHRDIKPANVFMLESTYDVFTKVLDFGLARSMDIPELETVTDTQTVVGTPQYLSPENLFESKVDHHSDLWALAVMAYEALTGEFPFQGATLPKLAMAIIDRNFRLPSDLLSGLPLEVDCWFQTCFE